MMENHPPLRSLCGLKDSVIEYQVTYIKEESASCGVGHRGDASVFVPQYHTQQYGSAPIKEEPFSYEDKRVMYSHKHPAAGPIQQYTSPYIKQEQDSYGVHRVDYKPEVPYTQCTSTSMKEEPGSCDRGSFRMMSGHTLQYPAAHVKEEPDSGDGRSTLYPEHNGRIAQLQQYPCIKEEPPGGGSLTNPDMYRQYPSAHMKEEPERYTDTSYSSPRIKEEGNSTNPAPYTPTDLTHYLPANVKKEPNEGNLTDPKNYSVTDPALHYGSAHVKEEAFSCHVIEQSENTEDYPYVHIKEEEEAHTEDMEIHTDHTQKTSSRLDGENTDSCDEADVSEQTPMSSGGVQHCNTDIVVDNSQNGRHPTQSTDVTFKCLECKECFTSKSDFEEHLALHRGKKIHVCSHCGKCFSYQSQRLIHERTHTGEKPFTCSECGKCFNQYVHLAIHLMSHTGEKPYVCSECGKSFNRKTTLTIHQRIHTGEKPFHCSQCGKYFSTSSNLIKHQRVHTGEKPYSCSECGELFVHYTQLIRHQASHLSEKPFSCVECGKSFSQKAQFLRHERFHKADNAYSCSECNQRFKQYKDLLVHQSTHTGQNPFKCPECGKQFNKKGALVSHQRLHSGEQPYSCTECGKSFDLSCTLNKHKEVHVKEKSCPEGRALSDQETLHEGYPASSGEETWSCSVGEEQFRENAALVEHMTSHR